MSFADIKKHLGAGADKLLNHKCTTIPKERLHLPGSDWVDRIFGISDRNIRVLKSLQALYGNGRLANTGYLSILPVDQGIEHTAGASFASNPDYFDSENIIKLAIEGGCNAVASTAGVLGSVARKYAHKIPFVLKFNHNELLTYPTKYDQIMFADVRQAADMGWWKWREPLSTLMTLGWQPFCGATYATLPLKPLMKITTFLQM